MARTQKHPESFLVKIKLYDGSEFETMSTRDMNGKLLQSDFDPATLPMNRTGVTTASEKEELVQKFRKRQGGVSFSYMSNVTNKESSDTKNPDTKKNADSENNSDAEKSS